MCTDVWIDRHVYRYVYKHACTHAYGHVHRRASRHVGQAMFAGIAVGGSVGDARPCQCRRACTAFFVLVLRDGIVDRPPQLSHERTEHLQRVLAATANRHIRTDVATRRRRLSSQPAGRDGPPPQPCGSRARRMVRGGGGSILRGTALSEETADGYCARHRLLQTGHAEDRQLPYVYTYVYTHMPMHRSPYMSIRTHPYTCMCTHVYAHVHTHLQVAEYRIACALTEELCLQQLVKRPTPLEVAVVAAVPRP